VIAHIVLLKLRPAFTADDRRRAIDALVRASAAIADVRRFRIGRRIRHGLTGYEQAMREDFEFALILEFDDEPALKRYLQAPAHGILGEMFATATSAALAYDYEIVEAADAPGLIQARTP
jgi:Stress responsive A/B Barrel Domain